MNLTFSRLSWCWIRTGAPAVFALRTRLGEPDGQGRRRPVPVPDSEFVMPADAVIMAFGFHPHGMSWLESHGVKVDNWGRIAASVESEFRYQTSNPKIFAGGDGARRRSGGDGDGRRPTCCAGDTDWLAK